MNTNIEYIENFEKNKEKKDYGTLLGQNGVMLGKIEDRFLIDDSKNHILLTMPSRTGKGVCCITPTLLRTWKESLFVLDIRDEFYNLTSGARQELYGNKILRFTPQSKNSCHYNPLAEIRILSKYEEEDIRIISDAICKVNEAGWNRAFACYSSDFVSAVIYYILYKNFLENPKFIYENGEKIPFSNATITEVIEFIGESDEIGKYIKAKSLLEKLKKISLENIIGKFGKDEETKNYVKEKLNNIYKNDIDRKIINNGNHPRIAKQFYKNFDLPFFSSILSWSISNLSIFKIPEIKENMSTSDFRMFDLMNSEKSVSFYYVISPANIIKLSPITEIFFKQMFDRLAPKNNNMNQSDKKKHKWKMLTVMDEFPAFGKIEGIEEKMKYFEDFGIKMLIVLQSMNQLFKIYGEKNKFISNCKIQVFGHTYDKDTTNYILQLCNKTKPFIKQKELERLPNDKLIIKKEGLNPIIADKFIYFKSEDFYKLTKIPLIFSERLYDKK